MARKSKKLFYKIGEVCEICGVEPHVLRYWESEFSVLSPSKNRSGQRIYRQKDLELIDSIKHLLYEEGYTIAGASRRLRHNGNPDLPLFRHSEETARRARLLEIRKSLEEIRDLLVK